MDVKTRSNVQVGKNGLDGTVYSGFGGAAVTAASAGAFKSICQKIRELSIAASDFISDGPSHASLPCLGETNAG